MIADSQQAHVYHEAHKAGASSGKIFGGGKILQVSKIRGGN